MKSQQQETFYSTNCCRTYHRFLRSGSCWILSAETEQQQARQLRKILPDTFETAGHPIAVLV
jgi:hypothetical protein